MTPACHLSNPDRYYFTDKMSRNTTGGSYNITADYSWKMEAVLHWLPLDIRKYFKMLNVKRPLNVPVH